MGDAKLEKQKKNLVEAGLMTPEENLIDFLQANYVEQIIGKFGEWKKGWAYFTEEKLIVVTGLLDGNIIIPYKNIRELEKCSQGLFPIGITITHEDMETGKTSKNKISLMKRDKWLEFLANKSGIIL